MRSRSNTAVVQLMITEVWNGHDPDATRRWMTPELHREAAEHVSQFLTAFPDVRVTVDDMFGERDRVVARLTVRGTHLGPFAGHPATGRSIEIESFRIYRLEDGRIAETWAMQDRLGLMQQLGLLRETGRVAWAGGPEPDTSTASTSR